MFLFKLTKEDDAVVQDGQKIKLQTVVHIFTKN